MIVTARIADRKLGALLCANTGGRLSVFCLQSPYAGTAGSGTDIVFVCSDCFEEIHAQNAVFIVRGENSFPKKASCRHSVVILDSSDNDTLLKMSGEPVKAITCGLGATDTFTFSSLTSECAVVSLQRTITAFDNTVIEPFELPIDLSCPVEPFLLLALIAVYCMLGQKNPLTGQSKWLLLPD